MPTNLELFDIVVARIRQRLVCNEQCSFCEYDYHRCYSQVWRDIRTLNRILYGINIDNRLYGKERYK